MTTPAQPWTLLVVDDDDVDVLAVRRAVRALPQRPELAVARDGHEALERLRSGALRQPCVLLLDLNMPGLDGIATLDALRADPDLCSTVVFVLTTSRSPDDVAAAYARQVAGYFVKDERVPLREILAWICRYAEISELPGAA